MLIFSVTLWHMSILFKVPLEDHPRMCGEQNQLLMDQVPIPGSPPRVRGTVHLCARSRRRSRITPACAGNRKSSMQLASTKTDHPRVCGEQLQKKKMRQPVKGSPPRVRGTDHDVPHGKAAAGITPACAGNSQEAMRLGVDEGDHPRVCGEQAGVRPGSAWLTGSPPRVRGTA